MKRFVKNPSLPEYKYLLEYKKDFDAAVSKDSVDRKIYHDLFPLIVNDCNEIIFHDNQVIGAYHARKNHGPDAVGQPKAAYHQIGGNQPA